MNRGVFTQKKVVAISRGIASEKIIDTAYALNLGGIDIMEVTFLQDDPRCFIETSDSIMKISSCFESKMTVGAGTVLNVEQVHIAADAGAKFIISPNTNIKVIEETRRLGLISIPGAMTPTEIVKAYEAGADYVKLFPATILETAYIKAIKSPLGHIPIMAVGGINETNAIDYIKAGADLLGVGGDLVKKSAIDIGDFEYITRTALSLSKNMLCTDYK